MSDRGGCQISPIPNLQESPASPGRESLSKFWQPWGRFALHIVQKIALTSLYQEANALKSGYEKNVECNLRILMILLVKRFRLSSLLDSQTRAEFPHTLTGKNSFKNFPRWSSSSCKLLSLRDLPAKSANKKAWKSPQGCHLREKERSLTAIHSWSFPPNSLGHENDRGKNFPCIPEALKNTQNFGEETLCKRN